MYPAGRIAMPAICTIVGIYFGCWRRSLWKTEVQLLRVRAMRINGRYLICAAILVAGFLSLGSTSAAVQTITSRSSTSGGYSGNGTATSASMVTCTSATASMGTNYGCVITAPGWSGMVKQGQSIGTSGAGAVKLTCTGQYDFNYGRLDCTAKIDDVACMPEQSINAISAGGGSTAGTAAVKSDALITCASITGAQSGTGRCVVQGPGTSVSLVAGQQTASFGPGAVKLTCSGIYSATGPGLQCGTQISQVCP